MGIAIKTDWKQIRSAVEATGDYEKVSEIFGIQPATLRQRARREGWMSPGKVRNAIKMVESRSCNGVSQSLADKAIAESWAEKGEQLRQLSYGKAVAALKSAKLKPASNARDFEILDKVARKAAGLESGDAQTNVAILPMQWGQIATFNGESVPMFEAETSDSPTPIEEVGES